MIYISLLNNLDLKIDTTDRKIFDAIKEHFSFHIPNYFFSPKYKSGVWDGKICLFNAKNRSIPYGLFFDLIRFCKKESYKVKIDKDVKKLYGYDLDELTFNYDLKYKPRDYQEEALKKLLKWKKGVLISCTGSGKSLIIAYTIKILIENGLIDDCLIIVPTTSLVTQFYEDLLDYGIDEKWLGKFYADEKVYDAKVLISTWQSLVYDNEKMRKSEINKLRKTIKKAPISKKDKLHQRLKFLQSKEHIDNCKSVNEKRESVFKHVGCVFVDETHTSKAKEIADLLFKIKKADYRFGCTGTMPESVLDVMQVRSYLGPIVKEFGVKELTKSGYINTCKIKAIRLYYNENFDKNVTLNEFKDISFNSPFRQTVINKLVTDCGDENLLFLVARIDKEGKILEKKLKEQFPDKQIKFLYSGVKPVVREEWRQKCINEKNVIIVAVFSLFQLGINIPNLSKAFLASSFFSKIRILQSIGRTLRKNVDKGDSIIYDLVDMGNKYGPKHFNSRKKLYENEGFEIEEIKMKEKDFNHLNLFGE